MGERINVANINQHVVTRSRETKSKPTSTTVPSVDVVVGFDPGEHTVAEVVDYLDDHPDETEAVLAAEKAGKNRTSLVGG